MLFCNDSPVTPAPCQSLTTSFATTIATTLHRRYLSEEPNPNAQANQFYHIPPSRAAPRPNKTLTMGISRSGVVVCIIVGAAAGVMLGWGMTHFFWKGNDPARERAIEEATTGNGQAAYQREVRLRHQDDLSQDYGYGRKMHYPNNAGSDVLGVR